MCRRLESNHQILNEETCYYILDFRPTFFSFSRKTVRSNSHQVWLEKCGSKVFHRKRVKIKFFQI